MDLELMKAAVTMEGVLSGTYALELFAEVERLTALCDEYRGAVEKLKKERTRMEKDASAERVEDLAIIWNLTDEKEALQSALTRARAEGMESGAVKVDDLKATLEDLSLHSSHALEDNAYSRAAYEAELTATAIRLAAKGEQ